ncbi:hypothetical protein A8B98_16525 [Hymenobacter sp. UV11]|nr:hypothetical protein A8B98_16525 [Hymenobacter sp. UV11]
MDAANNALLATEQLRKWLRKCLPNELAQKVKRKRISSSPWGLSKAKNDASERRPLLDHTTQYK